MADGKQTAQIQRDQQQAATPEEAHAAQIEGRLKDLHTCLPGIIVSFDPEKQTAQVQPAIQRIFTEKGAVNLPVCVDVPVQFPGGGDFFLTFPIKAGDECILWFSERAIDNWHMAGGTAPPAEYRLHDLSDGLAMVGLNSQPKAIPQFADSATQLRSRDGQFYIEITDTGKVRIQAQDIELHATKSYSWDVAGYGQRITHVGANMYQQHTWQQGAFVTNVSSAWHPPEGP